MSDGIYRLLKSEHPPNVVERWYLYERSYEILVELYRCRGGLFHYRVHHYEGGKAKEGEVKTVGSMPLDQMRDFALRYAALGGDKRWRQVCTEETPWDGTKRRAGVIHPHAREVGEQIDGWPAGDIVRMECPNCGKSWEEELPQ